jgi:hypothetical protein
LYTYCHNNPISYIDKNGHERIVVSGGIDGDEKFSYQFIETALRQVGNWKIDDLFNGEYNKENDITWVVANWNYTEKDIKNFATTAREHGINFMTIDDKQELFDYINKSNRYQDRRHPKICVNL